MRLIYDNVKLRKVEYIALTLTGVLQGGDCVVLVGDLGAGKTTLVSNLARVMESKEAALSPTFTIVARYTLPKSHRGINSITHVDTYRLTHANEIYDLGLETIFAPDTLTMIEWGERIEDIIDSEYFKITINESSRDRRSYVFETVGDYSAERLKELEDALVRDGWRND